MENNSQKIEELIKRLEEISRKQDIFSNEINNLRSEIQILKLGENLPEIEEKIEISSITEEPVRVYVEKARTPEITTIQTPVVPKIKEPKQPKQPSDLEKIIGESWLNKIGIIGIIIGVTILGKYSIDNNLISPLTRIILGYFVGIGLLGFGIKLKEKFESYSAVLVSGAMAIFYFITYFAYDFYGLIPQIMTFILMVVFTIFTVFAALKYNRSVIAHIGLVGAYAIPFLLSNNSGNISTLLIYITIINLGILAVSVKKYWKSLYYVSFGFTWLIFVFTAVLHYSYKENQLIGLLFATVFFLMFYVVAITNRILSNQKLNIGDVILLITNSFVYFGVGYGLLNSKETENFLGLFTLFNAVVHFGFGYLIKSRKIADKNLLYLVLGLVFTFIIIAVPIQLDGNWVTLSWIALTVLLFWIGRTKKVFGYETVSYILMILTFFSLLHDWTNYSFLKDKAFFNIIFLTSLFVLFGFGYIYYLKTRTEYYSEENQNWLNKVMKVILPILLGIIGYFTFLNEINLYFENWLESTAIPIKSEYDDYEYKTYNYNIDFLRNIVHIGYSILFFGIITLFNIKKFKSKVLGIVALIFTLISLFISQTLGLYFLGRLRDLYIGRASEEYYQIGFGYVLIRYLLFGLVAFGVYTMFKNSKQEFMNPMNKSLKFLAEFVFYLFILCFLSNELITWLDLAGNKGVFKLGLSILWGVYSLFLIYLGISKRKKYLRIGAIVLFAITLLKLVFYDISNLNTISKIIVFISLGVLLLIISFMYNKFKDKISDDEKNN